MKKKISNKLFDISPPPKIYKRFEIFEIFYQPKVSCKPLPAQFETKQHQKVTFCNRSPQKNKKLVTESQNKLV